MNDVALPAELASIVHPIDTDSLTTWEDHIQAFLEEQQKSESIKWAQADILLSVYNKFGTGSVVKFSDEIRAARSTIEHHLRTALAFPPQKRLPDVAFTTHTEASYIDPFNGKKQQFDGIKRFELMEEASINRTTVQEMKQKVKRQKLFEGTEETIIPCNLCGKNDREILQYIILAKSKNSSRRTADNLDLHEDCYLIVRQLIEDERKRRGNL